MTGPDLTREEWQVIEQTLLYRYAKMVDTSVRLATKSRLPQAKRKAKAEKLDKERAQVKKLLHKVARHFE